MTRAPGLFSQEIVKRVIFYLVVFGLSILKDVEARYLDILQRLQGTIF
jgi:hypothetical protein